MKHDVTHLEIILSPKLSIVMKIKAHIKCIKKLLFHIWNVEIRIFQCQLFCANLFWNFLNYILVHSLSQSFQMTVYIDNLCFKTMKLFMHQFTITVFLSFLGSHLILGTFMLTVIFVRILKRSYHTSERDLESSVLFWVTHKTT